GLLSELPASKKSVGGAKAVQAHFPAGEAGPLTILIRHDTAGPKAADGFFDTNEGTAVLSELIGKIEDRMSELGIADIRYRDAPMGLKDRPAQDASTKKRIIHKQIVSKAKSYYVSPVEEMKG